MHASKPMDCEELMVKQVGMTVAASPGTKAFVYVFAIALLVCAICV